MTILERIAGGLQMQRHKVMAGADMRTALELAVITAIGHFAFDWQPSIWFVFGWLAGSWAGHFIAYVILAVRTENAENCRPVPVGRAIWL